MKPHFFSLFLVSAISADAIVELDIALITEFKNAILAKLLLLRRSECSFASFT